MSDFIFALVKRYKYYFIGIFVFSCLVAAINTSFGLMLKWLADGLQSNDPNILMFFIFLFSVQRFLLPLAGGGGTLVSTMLASKIESDIRKEWYKYVVKLDNGNSKKKNSGEFQKKLQEAVSSVRALLNGTVKSVLSIALEVLSITIFAMLFISFSAGLVLLSFSFVYAFFIIFVTRRRLPNMREIVSSDSACAAFMHDSFINSGVISPEVRENRIGQHNLLLSDLESKKNMNSKSLFADSALSAVICAVVSFAVLIFYYGEGSVSVGVVVMLATSLAQMISQINTLGFNYRNILRAKIDLARVSEALIPRAEVEMGQRAFIAGDSYKFSFRNLKISDVDAMKEPIVSGDIVLNVGQINVLSGVSGIGKSSIARVMRGEAKITDTEVYLNGVSLISIQTNELLEKIGVVSQDVIIFNESIIKNLRYGKSNASREEVKSLLLNVGLEKFSDNLDYIVGEKGGLLSGGERQRLIIARGLLQKCEILILDEPFTGLDEARSLELASIISRLAYSVCILVIMHQRPTEIFEPGCIINEHIMFHESGLIKIKGGIGNVKFF